MPIYRFRVQKEDHDDSYRDIDIKPTQSYTTFNDCIQQAVKFDGTAVAQFFTSDDFWRRKEAVTATIKTTVGDVFPTEIADFVDNPHQRFLLYLETVGLVKTFHVELIKIIKEEANGAVYPCCVKEVGKPPRQYKKVILPTQAAIDDDDIKTSDKFFEESGVDDTEAYSVEEEVAGLDEEDEVELKDGFSEEGEEDDAEKDEDDFTDNADPLADED